MFDEIIDTFSSVFTITIIIFVVCIIAGIFKGIADNKKQAESKQKEEEENTALINTIISQSKKAPTSVLVAQRDEVRRVYEELAACKKARSLKIKEIAWIRVGNDFGCTLNFNTSHAILQYLDGEIAKRGGPKFGKDTIVLVPRNKPSSSSTSIEGEKTFIEDETDRGPTFSEIYEEERKDINRRQLVFVDCSGAYRRWGDSFVDFKGNWCRWGDGFYDYDGNYIRWGGTYKDSSGAYRRWGDDFIDCDGNWVRLK